MSGIIIIKIHGKVSLDVLNQIKKSSKDFAEFGIAILIKKSGRDKKSQIEIEVTKKGELTSELIQLLLTNLLFRKDRKGIPNTKITLKYNELTFTIPDDYFECINSFE